MTDAAPDAAEPSSNGSDAPTAPGIRVLAQFIRDLSFENPRAPDSLHSSQAQPQIDLGVEMSARGRIDGLFDVDLKLTATAMREGEAVFQLELVYGGLFGISGVAEEDLEPVLLIECPRFLFPFARRLIADLSTEGGFPPFLLDPLDFAAIYAARKAGGGQMIGNA
ncbi:MAG: protein-export protein SecB [Caulobacteraceae bacterium]|jgi:preprotein translocase subunit SecB|nr:protein-export protein SecB [Caulobacteraceae bacterium]